MERWPEHGPTLRSAILDALFTREEWLNAALDALDRRRLSAADLGASRRQRLLEHPSPTVRRRAAAVLAGSVDANRAKVVEAYRTVAQLPGDAGRGAALFQKTCSVCHRLGGTGHAVGPDLASVADRSFPALLTAILDPNRAIEARYINYIATTTDGRVWTGILSDETTTAITLLGPDGRQDVILRVNLESVSATGKSLMPEGLEADLPPQAMADLIAFIVSNAPPPKTFPGNAPEVARPAADGALELQASRCEIYGRTLAFEEKHKNLGFWTSEDDRAVWSLDVPKAGDYDVWLDWACKDDTAGNAFLIQAGAAPVAGKVAGTGTWDTYRQVKIGAMRLEAGPQRLVVRPGGPLSGALMDLRSVRLVPSPR